MSGDRPVASPPESSGALPAVELPAFSGPLDLLLHLIRKNEVSITDIPIFEITEQYARYLELMQELDLDVAAEYIYVLALLIHIKSRSLLPREPGAPEEDPRQELVRRLLEYEKFKRAAEGLHEVDSLRAGLWPRPEAEAPRDAEGQATLEVSLPDLITAFGSVLERYRLAHPAALEVRPLRFSLREKMIELVERLDRERQLPLLEFLGSFRYRAEAITAFLAVLELTRLEVIRIFQPAPFAEIHVSRTDATFDAGRVQDEYHD